MNLATLANIICIRSGQVQTKDVAACTNFLTFRHDQLYRSKLWKDSLIEWLYPVNPSNTVAYVPTANFMPTKGNVILPAIFQHVIASRTSEHKLDIDRPMLYYRVDQDQFAKTGTPLSYFLLAAAVWEFDVAQTLSFWNNNAADNQLSLTVDYAGTDGVSIQRTTTAPQTFFLSTDRIQSILKPVSTGSVDLVAAATNNILLTNNSAGNLNFTAFYQGGGNVNGFLIPGSSQVILAGGIQSISDGVHNIIAPSTANRGGTVSYTGSGFFFIWSVSPTILTLQAGDTEAPRNQRIRLLDIPTLATTLRVLGKRTVPPFAANSDIPGVDGMETVLMSMAYYDMLHRDERGGSKEASDALEEAAGLLRQLEGEEVYQGASNSRILPETGFGPDEYYIGPIF